MFNCNTPPPPYQCFFNSHNLSTVDPMSKFLGFFDSLKNYLSYCIIKVYIWEIKVFANLAIPWIIAHGPRPKNGKLCPWRNSGLKHHFKGIFLSFQKIRKKFTFDQRYENYAVETMFPLVQLKSVVTCKECQFSSVRFDPFTFLSLPLPMESTVNLEVIGES